MPYGYGGPSGVFGRLLFLDIEPFGVAAFGTGVVDFSDWSKKKVFSTTDNN